MAERHTLEKKTQSFRRHVGPDEVKTRKRSSSAKRNARPKSRSKSRGRAADESKRAKEKRRSRSSSRSKAHHGSVEKNSPKQSWAAFEKSDSLHSMGSETSPTGSLSSESSSQEEGRIREVAPTVRGRRSSYSDRKLRSQSCPRMQHEKQVRFSLNGAIATPNKPSEKMDETTATRMANLVSELIGESDTTYRKPTPSDTSKLNVLSVKELKHKLEKKGIDYSDCLEKQDLVRKLSSTSEDGRPSGEEKKQSKSSSKSKKSSKKEKSKRGVTRQRSSSLPPMRREREEDDARDRSASTKRSGRKSRRETESSRGRDPMRGVERQRSSSLPPNAGLATSEKRRGRRSRDRDNSPQRGVERQRSSSLPPHDETSRRRRGSRRDESLPAKRGMERKRSSSLPPNGTDGKTTRRGSRRSSFAESKGKSIHPTLGGSQQNKQRSVRDEHDWMLFDKSSENAFNCDPISKSLGGRDRDKSTGRTTKNADCVSNGVRDVLASHWNDVLDFGAAQGHVAAPDEAQKKNSTSKSTNKTKRRNRRFSLGLFSSKKYGSV